MTHETELHEYDPFDFADPEYATEYQTLFNAYIDLRVKGIPGYVAVIDAFELIRQRVSLRNVEAIARAADANPYVRARFAPALAAKDVHELWDDKMAVHNLLKLLETPTTSATVKVMCVDRLNVLLGITEIEATGKQTLAQKSLADFYARRVKRTDADTSTDTPTTH